jgi:alpha-beta hydrolase superfamily lysophospholipase
MNAKNRRSLWLALRLALYALLVFGGLALFQDRLIYHPETTTLAAALADARRDGLAPWPAADDYRGLVREPRAPARATLLLFHGNAGHAGHRAWYADELAKLGIRTVLAEYPAYGPRPGHLGEESFVADAVQTLAEVRRRHPGPLILAGESIGAGVAAAAHAKAPDGVTALLLITPFDTLENVARHHFPWAPVRWLLRDRYDNRANLAHWRGRTAVVVAAEDTIVPAPLGRALFGALPEPKRLWTIAAADHNDWPERVDAAWWLSVTGFLLDN